MYPKVKAVSFSLLVLLLSSAILVIANPSVVYASSCTATYSPSSPPPQQLTISSSGTYCFDAGTYDTRITIAASNVTLTGAPGTTASSVVIKPSTVTNNAVDPIYGNVEAAIVYANGGTAGITGVTVEGLTVDGSAASSSITNCGSVTLGYYVGILFSGASGAITNTQVTPPQAPAPNKTESAAAAAILPDHIHYVTNATYDVGNDIQLSTIVPSGTDPVSIQGFSDGTPEAVLNWNVAETGYNYIIDGGAATQVGNNTLYTKVTFADGNVVESNNVYITVQPATATGTPAVAGLYGCQSSVGLGIIVGSPAGVTSTVSISQNNVTNYQKGGVSCWEKGTTCNISGNYISPLPAAAASYAPNGALLLFGATGTITGNTISSNLCDIPGVCGAGLVTQQQSCGIVTFLASAGVSITDNQLPKDDIGICLGADVATVSTTGNNINASTYAGIEVYDESQTVSGNTVSNSTYGIVPISDASSYPATVGYSDTFTSIATPCFAISANPGIATCSLLSSSIPGM
jgi:hypothetical protein